MRGHPDGINWSIDRSATTLRSGYLAPGQRTEAKLTVQVEQGNFVYLVIYGVNDTNCTESALT